MSARGTPFVLHSYSLEAGGNSYVAQTALYPADVDTRQPKAVLQAALDARAQQLAGGKWSTANWREIDGATAVESTGALANGSAVAPALGAEGAALRLARLPRRRPSRGPEADRFFRSLKIK